MPRLPLLLDILTMLADGSIAVAFAWALHRARHTPRWRSVLAALLCVAVLNMLDPALRWTLGPRGGELVPLTHLAGIGALAAGALLLRREVLLPFRVLDSLASHDGSRDRFIDAAGLAVLTLTPEGRIIQANTHASLLLGLSAESLAGRVVFSLHTERGATPDIRAGFAEFVSSYGVRSAEAEYPMTTPSGPRVVRWRRSLVLDEAGEVTGVVSFGEDVTPHRRTEARLQSESYLLDSVGDSVTVTDLDGGLVYLNHAAHALLGYTRDEFRALGPLAWIADESRGLATEKRRAAQNGGLRLYETLALHKDGSRIPLESRSQLVHFEGRPAVMTVSRDIRERREAEDLIVRLAFNDPLTGLANRRLLNDRLSHALARAARHGNPPSVLYIDVDNLKTVNDAFGHEAGDELVCRVAERLAAEVRQTDTLGRCGGDEFVLVLADGDDDSQPSEVATRLLRLFDEPVLLSAGPVRVTVSIGIYTCEPGLAADESIKRADRAMYLAKKSGGNRICVYSPEMESDLAARFELKNELREGLEHQLELHYQPIVTAADGRIRGAEALVRWRHPRLGLLSPDTFIPLAEECGLIIPLGRWVLRTACEQLARWRADGIPLERIAVNLSPTQLLVADIAEEITDLLESTGLRPSDIELEVTETVAMEDIEAVAAVFERLRGLGMRVSLDDFGTGHSSLERLRTLPITTLKIDRSFVNDLCSTSTEHPIIDTVLLLADRLGLAVVAEGVEAPCQLDYLRRSGCHEIQGYLFSRPIDAASFAALADRPALEGDPNVHEPCARRDECPYYTKRSLGSDGCLGGLAPSMA